MLHLSMHMYDTLWGFVRLMPRFRPWHSIDVEVVVVWIDLLGFFSKPPQSTTKRRDFLINRSTSGTRSSHGGEPPGWTEDDARPMNGSTGRRNCEKLSLPWVYSMTNRWFNKSGRSIAPKLLLHTALFVYQPATAQLPRSQLHDSPTDSWLAKGQLLPWTQGLSRPIDVDL